MEVDFRRDHRISSVQAYGQPARAMPIALVPTQPDGTANAAPFSMFNILGEEPPIVMINVNRLGMGTEGYGWGVCGCRSIALWATSAPASM